LIVSYSVNGTDWIDLGEVILEEKNINYSVALPSLTDSEMANLQVSVQAAGKITGKVYLDSVWVEVEYKESDSNNNGKTGAPRFTFQSDGFVIGQVTSSDKFISDDPQSLSHSCTVSPLPAKVIGGNEALLELTLRAPLDNKPFQIRTSDLLPEMAITRFEEVSKGEEAGSIMRKYAVGISVNEAAPPASYSFTFAYDLDGGLTSAQTAVCLFSLEIKRADQ
jgi:hypothetical protein